MSRSILCVALNTPVMRLFDYRAPPEAAGRGNLRGCRVAVPFGKSLRFGIVVAQADSTSVPDAKLKTVKDLIDSSPILDESMMALLEWAANYYRHPPGEVFSAAIPAAFRKGAEAIEHECVWQLSAAG